MLGQPHQALLFFFITCLLLLTHQTTAAERHIFFLFLIKVQYTPDSSTVPPVPQFLICIHKLIILTIAINIYILTNLNYTNPNK